MTMSYIETHAMIDLVLKSAEGRAREDLHRNLVKIGRTEPEFYGGVLSHCDSLPYSSNQWFELLSKLPIRILYDDPILMRKLSPAQREKLRS